MAARPLRHWLLLGALVAVWGSAFGLTKIAIEGFSPTVLVTGRCLVAGLVLGALVWLRGQSLPRDRRFWQFSLAMAVIGNCLPFWLITRAQQVIDSSLAGILMAVMPLATLVLAHFLVPGERLTRGRLAGFLLGLVGIVVLIGPEALLELRGRGTALLFELATLAAALCYATNAILARRRPAYDALTAGAGVMLVSAAVMLPFGGAGLLPEVAAAPARPLLAAGALALLGTALGPVLFLRLVMLGGAGFAALINYLIPLWALLLGVLLLGEQPRWTALLALVLILGGIALSEARGRPGPASAPAARGD